MIRVRTTEVLEVRTTADGWRIDLAAFGGLRVSEGLSQVEPRPGEDAVLAMVNAAVRYVEIGGRVYFDHLDAVPTADESRPCVHPPHARYRASYAAVGCYKCSKEWDL